MVGYSNKSNRAISDLFPVIFPDSPTAAKYQLGPEKLHYSINFGLSPFFQGKVMHDVQNSYYYSLSFDESLNRVTQSSEMDLMVRYLEHSDFQVKTRYVTSEFLGHARHNDLYQNFLSSAEGMDERKLRQMLRDGPSLNLKFVRLLQLDQKKKDI